MARKPANPLQSKLSILRGFMTAGDWRAALRLADSFGDLGTHKTAIERGWAAIKNPGFYREINRDPDQLIADARAALVARYGDPADGFKNSEM